MFILWNDFISRIIDNYVVCYNINSSTTTVNAFLICPKDSCMLSLPRLESSGPFPCSQRQAPRLMAPLIERIEGTWSIVLRMRQSVWSGIHGPTISDFFTISGKWLKDAGIGWKRDFEQKSIWCRKWCRKEKLMVIDRYPAGVLYTASCLQSTLLGLV